MYSTCPYTGITTDTIGDIEVSSLMMASMTSTSTNGSSLSTIGGLIIEGIEALELPLKSNMRGKNLVIRCLCDAFV